MQFSTINFFIGLYFLVLLLNEIFIYLTHSFLTTDIFLNLNLLFYIFMHYLFIIFLFVADNI
jgi:hypothetical protein